jgi:phospholipase C
LYEKGMKRYQNLTVEFENDLKKNTLPQVSFIIPPTYFSEHASNHPQAGEAFVSRFIETLAKEEYSEIYAKTALILNYDEGG